jgi:hypothetical protein
MKDKKMNMRLIARNTEEMDAAENFAHALINAPEVKSALADPHIPRPVVMTLICKEIRLRSRRLKLC